MIQGLAHCLALVYAIFQSNVSDAEGVVEGRVEVGLAEVRVCRGGVVGRGVVAVAVVVVGVGVGVSVSDGDVFAAATRARRGSCLLITRRRRCEMCSCCAGCASCAIRASQISPVMTTGSQRRWWRPGCGSSVTVPHGVVPGWRAVRPSRFSTPPYLLRTRNSVTFGALREREPVRIAGTLELFAASSAPQLLEPSLLTGGLALWLGPSCCVARCCTWHHCFYFPPGWGMLMSLLWSARLGRV